MVPPHTVTVALEIVSYVGVSLSLLGLVLTILTLLIFKSLRQRDASKFHIQLCLSLIFMLIVFVVGIDRVSVRAGCITVGVLIHYFALVSWMWMGAEAVLMFKKIVVVFSNITIKYLLVLSVICWTLPLLPIIIVLSIKEDYYITFYSNTNDQVGFCFLGHLTVFLTTFLVPVFLILIFNLVMYILILRVLILHTVRKKQRQGKSTMTPSEAVKMILSFTGIMFLLGLTWIFGIFTFISEPGVSYTLQFLFAFFNAFQGFFIFIFFVVLSSDARAAWKSLLCPWSIENKQKTSKCHLSSDKKTMIDKKSDFSDFSKNSSDYSSLPPSLPTPFLPSLSENENRVDATPKSIGDIEFKGARITRRSTRKHTHHIEEVKLDFFDSDTDDYFENDF
ncbi:PREDICTED: adhesion G-protein coupled receptor G2-like [Amphimedon queenslandica]|nr:PREDICTED: adhesion G-protein coupled receptor G2-like [Amphimedon queenslandica]|eukprot:XP_019855105.1 PREDICTED: adhesion G-protein coupled receptor G2-like [Amphimedon queenslandica]